MNPEPGVGGRLHLLRGCKIFPVGQIQCIAHFKIKFYWYTVEPLLIFSRAVFYAPVRKLRACHKALLSGPLQKVY